MHGLYRLRRYLCFRGIYYLEEILGIMNIQVIAEGDYPCIRGKKNPAINKGEKAV